MILPPLLKPTHPGLMCWHRWLMCWHRWLTSSRLPCSVPLRTRYAPPLPPSVQSGAVPPDGHHPPSWHRENHSAYP
ncbi:TPA: hypothetical protein HL428_25445, partial [Escherichia coli]|nr:hypothetical protein [Escherichia coli]